MNGTEASQYAPIYTPTTPTHMQSLVDAYQMPYPSMEQSFYSQPSPRPYRPRPPVKTPTQGRQHLLGASTHRFPQIQESIPQSSMMVNFNSTPERISPIAERRSSPDTDFDTYNVRAKSISPTNSESKSNSSSSSNLHSISPDSAYIPATLVNQADVIESNSGQGGMAETGFNQLGCTLGIQETGSLKDEEVREENELSPSEGLSCSSIAIMNSTSSSPPLSAQGVASTSSSPSRLPSTPTLAESSMLGVQSKTKPVMNGVGRGAIGRGVKSKKRLNSIGEHNVGALETAPCGWGDLPINPKENFDDGTEFWGQPDKPAVKPPDSDILMYLKPPYTSFAPYEMNNSNNNTKHSPNYASLTDQQKRILQEIMQSNFDIPSDEGTPTHPYTPNVNSLYQRHFSETGLQSPSMQQFIMQRSVIHLLMKQQYLQMQEGFTLVKAVRWLLRDTKMQHQKLYSSLYQQGSKSQYSAQLNLNLQISSMLINLLQLQLTNVTAQPINGFPMNNQYLNKSVYLPNLSETPSFDPHFQEYQLYSPSQQTPRQGQAKNQQWIVQQLVKFHMFNNENENNKNESKSVGKDPMGLGFTKSLDPSFNSNDSSQMKYNLIRSSSLVDHPEYRQRKQNSSMSALHMEENFNFSADIPTLYEGFADKIESEEAVFDSYDRVPPSPSFNSQGHTFSPKAPAFYPPGHFQEPVDAKLALFSSLPANLNPPAYEPSPHLFYPNKPEPQLEYDVFPPDLYQNKQTTGLDMDSLSSRSHNKSPNQFNDKFNHGLLANSNTAKLAYPNTTYPSNYMVDSSSSTLGMKHDLLTQSLPTGLGFERSDAAWLFLTGINAMIDKAQLERHLSPLGSTSIAYSKKNRTAIVTFKQGADASRARSSLKGTLGSDAFDTCDISSDPNELTHFIGKFAESPGSPVRNPAPWSYNGFSCGSIDSVLPFVDTPMSYPDAPQEEMSPFEEQIVLNYLPNGLLNNP